MVSLARQPRRLNRDTLGLAGTVYAGSWKSGLRHGDGICRVARDTILDPIGGVANAIRRIGATTRKRRHGLLPD